MAFSRGVVADKPCTRCTRGCGPFTQCVTLDGEFNGACCNCRADQGRRCDFHSLNSAPVDALSLEQELSHMLHLLSTRSFSDTASKIAARIYRLPQVRELEIREGKSFRLEEHRPMTEYQKRVLESALAFTRGVFSNEPCKDCIEPQRGLFKQCIILPGEFGGACCNCHSVNHRYRCQHHRRMRSHQKVAPTLPRQPNLASFGRSSNALRRDNRQLHLEMKALAWLYKQLECFSLSQNF